MNAKTEIRATVERLGTLMFERNPGLADEFAPAAMLVGSEPGEVADGREAIRALIAGLHARADRYTWAWDRLDIAAAGSVGWFFAEGALVVTAASGTTRHAYRLSGVLERSGARWLWRLFHGSEPRV